MVKKLLEQLFLPNNIKPLVYKITLTPDLESHTFDGKINIALNILEATNCIILHAKDLKIKSVFLDIAGKQIIPSEIILDKENEKLALIFSEDLKPVETYLNILYSGILNDQMSGFYRSTYIVEGENRMMAVTQFEDTSARMAFPCFDEPNIKARFKVELIVPKNLDALSNTKIEKVVSNGSSKTVTFEETPIISTYILAFCVGEFECIESLERKGMPRINVYTTSNKKELGRFALGVAESIIVRCSEYFDHPYMGTKLDLIAIPDFAAGAMENLGLITFRESAILIDE